VRTGDFGVFWHSRFIPKKTEALSAAVVRATFAFSLLISTVAYPEGFPEPKVSGSPHSPSGWTRQARDAVSQEATTSTDFTTGTAVLLKEGTPVKLKLLHTLNSKTAVPDDPLNFAVAEDVVVDGRILVKAGAPAIGRVRHVKPARTLGRGAELGMDIQYLRVGRTRVPLRGSPARKGKNKTGDTVALGVIFGLGGLVKHGSEIEVKEGSFFTAYVDQDTIVPTTSGSS
jgi:hypothetical protein